MKKAWAIVLIIVLAVWAGCGPPESNSAEQKVPSENNPEGALSEWQIVHGVGPVKQKLQLAPIDMKMVQEGEMVFETKCSMCHKMDERYVGPALRLVSKNRSPEYVMNMILDPTSMVKYHPEVKRLLAEYFVPMTFQNVSEEDARKILEYLRHVAEEAPEEIEEKD